MYRVWLCIVILTAAADSARSQVFLSEDFESVGNPGLPSGWTSAPSSLWATGIPDDITPNSLNGLNASLNNAAHAKAVGIDGTNVAADGAMLTSPDISLPISATNAVLTYDVVYFNIQSNAVPPETESLIFIVSTDRGATWTDVAFVGPTSQFNPWASRSVPMGAYAGESSLKFGFRYNNQGGNLIGAAFDNFRLVDGTDGRILRVFAGDHPDPSTGIGYQLSGSGTTLTGAFQNTGSTTISNYYIRYTVANGPVQSSPIISTPIAPMDTAVFPPGLTVAIPANSNYTVKSWIEVPGDVDHPNDTATATIVGVPYIPIKRPVFEEATGTWCGWCPRGAVFMDQFAAGHLNGVAAQITVHNTDPMTVPAYDSFIADYIGGFPTIVVDRNLSKDPRSIDTAFDLAQNNFGFADLTIGSPIISGNRVSIPVSIKPVVTISNPRLALVITESNVIATDTGIYWPQTNYYAGGSEIMGGWEQEAYHVVGAYYHFVARSITPSPEGSIDSLPATLITGTTYTTTLTDTLNTGLWKLNDLQYIALLINGDNNALMNSAFTALPQLIPTLSNVTAISEVDNGILKALVYPNPTSGKSYLAINVKDAAKAVATVLDITGRRLLVKSQSIHTGNNTIELETSSLAPGNYVVDVATGKAHVALRLQVYRQ